MDPALAIGLCAVLGAGVLVAVVAGRAYALGRDAEARASRAELALAQRRIAEWEAAARDLRARLSQEVVAGIARAEGAAADAAAARELAAAGTDIGRLLRLLPAPAAPAAGPGAAAAPAAPGEPVAAAGPGDGGGVGPGRPG